MALTKDLVASLKRLLKAQGITYAALAERLSVSEATIKRQFSTQRLTLERLEQVCDVLGVGLPELATEAARGRPALARLDEAAEEALVADPALLLALYLVLNRWTQEEVLARYRFSLPEWTALLARLDRFGVIELQPGNRCRLLTARNFRWRRGGPMERLFRERLLPTYFAPPFDGSQSDLVLLSGMLAPSSAERMARRIEELAGEFEQLVAHDGSQPAAERVGMSLVLARRPWSLGLFDRFRRDSADASVTSR